MPETKDGGPGLPEQRETGNFHIDLSGYGLPTLQHSPSIPLRDYFLAHAPDLYGDSNRQYVEYAFPELGQCPSWEHHPVENSKWWIRANVLYKMRYADIMLAERERVR